MSIGADTIIYPFACLGFPPQDVKVKLGDPTPGIVIGSKCTIREHATVHSASHATIPTTIGDRAFFMVNAHVGHDAQVGNDVILVNNASLGGHSIVGDRVTLGGHTAIHQFVKIGRFAFLSGGLAATCDVPPFTLMARRNEVSSVNVVGMRRNGFSNEDITATRLAFRKVFRGTLQRSEMLEILDEIGAECKPVAEIAEFIRNATRPICHGLLGRGQHVSHA
jgi:UDP-N-acetylglucosamine acyltransferase